MSATFLSVFQKGLKLSELVKKAGGLSEEGKKFTITVDDHCVAYLDHTLSGWTDGPPTSTVAWVLSGADPEGGKWRRFTLSKSGPWQYQLAAFPTPFKNEQDPLSPGVPPSSSKRR